MLNYLFLKALIAAGCIFLNPLISLSQNQLNANGAFANAMGNTAVATSNAWGLFNNIAAIGSEQEIKIISTTRLGMGMSAMNTYASGIILPMHGLVVGAQLQHFGDKLYSEEAFSVGAAHKIGSASIGGKAHLLQFRGETLGSQISFAFDFGVITQLSESLSIGAYMFNFTQNTLSKALDETLPSYLQIGISYQPDEVLLTNLEIEQHIGHSPIVKMGLAYAPLPFFKLCLGAHLPQGTTTLGTSICLNQQFSIDYAMELRKYPGLAHQFSLLLDFGKNKKQAS